MSFVIAPGYADSMNYLYTNGIEKLYIPIRPARLVTENQAYVRGDIPHGLVIFQPFLVNIEREEDQTYVISDDLFLVYGNGENLPDALNDYILSLSEYYQILEQNANLNPFDKMQFEYLQTYIHPE